MAGLLYQYLSDDHDRLDSLLKRAVATPGVIDMEPYAEFRKGLLRHISILKCNNSIEEQAGGLYELFEELAASEAESILAQLKAAPAVPVLPHNEKPDALETTKSAVARAGYEFKTAIP